MPIAELGERKVEPASAGREKVLELNQNIFNQIPTIQPTTAKSAHENGCIARGYIKVQAKEEKFNIKAKREQIENIKKTIKDKLISLNNKSKSIETLLEDDVPVARSTAFKSYRGAYNKSVVHTLTNGVPLADPIQRGEVVLGANPMNNKSQFLVNNAERQAMHKPNCSTIETVIGAAATALGGKEKENKNVKLVHCEQPKGGKMSHSIKDPSDALVMLLQKTMRI